MHKALKISLAVFGGLLVLVLGVAAFVIATFDPNRYKPELIDTVEQRYQRTLAIPGRIELTLFPRLGVRLGEVTLSERQGKQPAGARERFASIQSAQVSLALWPLLKRQVVMDRIEFTGARARVVQFKDGKFNFDDLLAGGAPPTTPTGTKPEASQSTPLAFDIAALRIADAEITYDDQKAPRRVHLSKLGIEAGRIAPLTPIPLLLKTRLEVDSPRLGSELALKGRLSFAPAPGHAVAKLTFDGLELDLDGKLDTLPLKARITGVVNADLAANKLDAKLAGQFDESKFSATVGMPRFTPATYTFDAEIDRINVDRYRGTPAAAAPNAPAAPAAPEKPLDLSALRDLDASGQLRIGAVQVMNLKLSQVRAGLKAAGGRLALSPLAAELYQGKLSGSATLTAAAPTRVALQQTLEGIAIGPLLKDLTGNDALQGRGQVALDVTTAGPTVSAMTRALGGTARLTLADGAFRGINVAQKIRSARAAIAAVRGKEAPADGGGTAANTASKGETTDFSELSASFRITNGVARNDDLSAKSPLLRLGGRGDIDLGASRLDYTVLATVVATLEGQGGPELQALRGQTIPVRLTGPFSAIDWRIDLAAMAKGAAKEKVEEKKEELKQEARRRLDDKLRDLLRK
jgi:AsmA protein